jgi:hypothetical protein
MGASRRDDEMEAAEKRSFLRALIEGRRLDQRALGITKQVIDKGEDSLSPRQKLVFQRDVLDEFVTAKCRCCDGKVPWPQMYLAYYNGGYCGGCAYDLYKS